MRFLVIFFASLFLANAANAATVPTFDIDFSTCHQTENTLECGVTDEGPFLKIIEDDLNFYSFDSNENTLFKSTLFGLVTSGFTQNDQFAFDFSDFGGNFDIDLTLKRFGEEETTTLSFSTFQFTNYLLEWATIAQNLNWEGCGLCGPTYAVSGISITPNLSTVPLPAAFPLYAAGMGIIGLLGWRRKQKTGA